MVAILNTSTKHWSSAWLDAVAFAFGLGLAWEFQWDTTDLVWSLWLSSLVVGYAMILVRISAPLRELVRNIAADTSNIGSVWAKMATIAIFSVGTLFGLAFFTVHFGGFHFVHSAFLQSFFPVTSEPMHGLTSWSMYAEVVSRYWWFLPAAFIAERNGFHPAAQNAKNDGMMAPYKNVIRMHLLIFFFAFAKFTGLDGFPTYAVVYAVYFFPWRLLRRDTEVDEKSTASTR